MLLDAWGHFYVNKLYLLGNIININLRRFKMKDAYFVSIKDIVDEGNKRVTYIFNRPEDMTWKEGSNISMALKEALIDGKINKNLSRKFSIATIVDEDLVAISTRLDSSDSDYKKGLASLCIGDGCILYDSQSHMPIRRENKKLVMISMGVGMATIRPIIKTYVKDTKGVSGILNICVDRSGDYLYRDEIVNDTNRNIEILVAKSRYELKSILNDVSKIDYADSIFYIVGSKEFLKSVIRTLKYHGVGQESIMIDKSKAALETYYNSDKYDSLKIKDYHKTSKNFKPLA